MEIKKERALVTGGGGFLGKAVVKQLLQRGDDVASLSRNFYPELDKMGVEQFQGDICDLDAVEEACRGVDIVFHTAARAGLSARWRDYFEPNVIGTQNVVKGSLKNGVTRLVHTSSPSVVFDGSDMEGVDESAPYPARYHAPYPETKAMAEKVVLNATSEKLKTIILRPHLIWGPGDNHLLPGMIARAKRLKIIGDGRNRVDTIYIDNAAHAHLLAGDRLKADPSISGRIYFISQGEPVLLWKMVDNMLGAAGLPPVQGRVSARGAQIVGWVAEMVCNLLKIKQDPPMTRFMAKELSTSHWFDISRAECDLGYRPIISTEQGLIRLKEWLLSEEKVKCNAKAMR